MTPRQMIFIHGTIILTRRAHHIKDDDYMSTQFTYNIQSILVAGYISSYTYAMQMPIDANKPSICKQANGQLCDYKPMTYERIMDVQPG